MPSSSVAGERELKDLHDAFTGESLNPALPLYQCNQCKVYYHQSSFDVILAENAGKCVGCSHAVINSIKSGQPVPRGRDNEVDVVTLTNFRAHVGRVVTLEGIVPRVNFAKSGKGVAVMFEDKPWISGLKMVVFRGALGSVGGTPFLLGLKGKKVRVRGLLVNHPTFGYEIIVNQRSMILSVN